MNNLNDLLEIMREHQKADRLVQGAWLQDEKINGQFRGCFYGCAMQSDDNPIESACSKFGLPLWIGYWSEKCFESLPKNEAMVFPVDLLEKIVGYKGDLEILRHSLAIKRLEKLSSQNEGAIKSAIDGVLHLHMQAAKGVNKLDWLAAWSAARSAARSAASSAASSDDSSASWSASWQQERDLMYELLEQTVELGVRI